MPTRIRLFAFIATVLALVLPTAVIFNLPPSTTLFNQVLAGLGFGALLVALGRGWGRPLWRRGQAGPLLLLCALQAGAALASGLLHGTAMSTVVGTTALCLAAMLLVVTGVGAAQRGWGDDMFTALAWAFAGAGLLQSTVCLVQIVAPGWTDGVWIAQTTLQGRAIGNLRQPNLVALLAVWGLLGLAWLHESGRLTRAVTLALAFALVLAVVLTASRAGQLMLLALTGFGVWERRRAPRAARVLWMVLPLALLAWAMHAGFARWVGAAFGSGARLAEGAASPPRVRILIDAWQLTLQHPLTGVGWGELNFAWTLHPNPLRTQYYFDHTHNLLLQWAVELGLPLAILLTALLGLSLWRAARRAAGAGPGAAWWPRAAFAAVLLGVLHNQLEFPFWYAWFLLPAALSMGLLLAGDDRIQAVAPGSREQKPLLLLGLLMMLASALLVQDYMRMVPVFAIPRDAPPIERRLEGARQSLVYTAQTEWGAATKQRPSADLLRSAQIGAHTVVDVRLLWAWANALHLAGDTDRARFLAQRLREFPGAEAQSYFAACAAPAAASAPPFQCQPAQRSYDFGDFRPPGARAP